uniref:Small ribosomal subunit protein bS6c n=1 Tax=Triparma laevis TaxID=1534972 RepID=A0A0K2RX53_9STRA|nr:chloroplast 30S ribosomal protein S6 [Triparma laevis]BAS19147.1 chloroplast 30S ribosomal protein S6 [Triparma laevis]
MFEKVKYEMMILLNEEFNDSELKTWAFKYAKELQNLGGSEISVISRGKRNLAYSINEQTKGNFIEMTFSMLPNNLEQFHKILDFDDNVLRSLILRNTNLAIK